MGIESDVCINISVWMCGCVLLNFSVCVSGVWECERGSLTMCTCFIGNMGDQSLKNKKR